MSLVSRVLICIDFSDYSKDTLKYGSEIAGTFRAEPIVVNVINQRDVDAVAMASRYYPEAVSVESFIDLTRSDRIKRLEELAASLWPGTDKTPRFVVRVGIPFVQIIETIEEEGADIVVLGSKGRGNLSRTLLGSTAEKVFRHSPVPVLSVRHARAKGRTTAS